MILIAMALLLPQEAVATRAWLSDDPRVQFEDGARIRGVMPSARDVREYQVVVVCQIQPDFSLASCESARVTPEDEGLRRGGPDAVGQVRIKDVEGGPRPGESLVFDIRVQASRRSMRAPG